MYTLNPANHKHRQLFYLLIFVFVGISTAHTKLYAISQTEPATPSSTVYSHGGYYIGFDQVTPTTGNWTSSNTSLTEGVMASYTFPEITNTCSAATISSLTVNIETTAIEFAPGTTQDLAGIMVAVVNKSSPPYNPVQLQSIISGATWLSDPNLTARGITNPLFSNPPASIPGNISVNINTTGMTVETYNDRAITVFHDLLDAYNGFVTSITSSQPTVSVTTDDSPCYPPPTQEIPGPPEAGSARTIEPLHIMTLCGIVFTLVFIRSSRYKHKDTR